MVSISQIKESGTRRPENEIEVKIPQVFSWMDELRYSLMYLNL
jgi:hypothetical protein